MSAAGKGSQHFQNAIAKSSRTHARLHPRLEHADGNVVCLNPLGHLGLEVRNLVAPSPITLTAIWRLAGSREAQGLAHLTQLRVADCSDASSEAALADKPEIVEAEHALDWHAIGRSKQYLGRNVTDRPRSGNREELVEYGHTLVAGQD